MCAARVVRELLFAARAAGDQERHARRRARRSEPPAGSGAGARSGAQPPGRSAAPGRRPACPGGASRRAPRCSCEQFRRALKARRISAAARGRRGAAPRRPRGRLASRRSPRAFAGRRSARWPRRAARARPGSAPRRRGPSRRRSNSSCSRPAPPAPRCEPVCPAAGPASSPATSSIDSAFGRHVDPRRRVFGGQRRVRSSARPGRCCSVCTVLNSSALPVASAGIASDRGKLMNCAVVDLAERARPGPDDLGDLGVDRFPAFGDRRRELRFDHARGPPGTFS